MRAFITGGSGFVGKHLAAHLSSCGDQVFAQDSSDFDIRNYSSTKAALAAAKPDVIFHLAGFAFVPECEVNFGATLEVNVLGTENILKAVREVCPDAVTILISTGDAYGIVASSDLPSKETDRLKPINNYSLSKVFVEQLGHRAREAFKQRIVIMRPFNHIGPGQSSRFAISSFAEQLAQMKVGQKPPILRVGNLSAKRDLTDVRDIVRGYRLAAATAEEGVFNLCTGQSRPITELLDMLIKIAGISVQLEIDPDRLRPSDNPETRGSFEQAKNKLGWEPKISLETSLKDCFSDILSRL